MSPVQQCPIFSDIARPMSYVVRNPPNASVQITTANGSRQGSVTMRPQSYFIWQSVTCFTNYDNVAPVIATANSSAILPQPFAPNNFTVTIDRGTYNKYSNLPIPQALLCSTGTRAGKVFPFPVILSPRTNIIFTFQDTTGLFLLTATSQGTAVPLTIQMFLNGVDVPLPNWQKFCAVYPDYAAVFAPDQA